jgi:hypothetical protein
MMEDDMPAMVGMMERDLSGFSAAPREGEVLVPGPAQTMMMQTSREITAKRVAVPRHIPHILREIREMCAAFGDTYVWSWEVKNRREGRMDTIKGPTIKLAMMLVQAFGNCSVDMDIQETPTHWIFKSWFMDYEKGTSLSRLFQQRKSQNTGMADKDRAADMIFQMGQSKAARNVVVNALSSFSSFAVEEAEKGLLSKFQSPEAKESAWNFIDRVLEQHDIDIARVEAVIGRRSKEWTVPNLAKAFMMLRGIAEGLASADDQFPTLEAAAEMLDEQETDRQTTKKRTERTQKPKADPKPQVEQPAADKPKPAETKPDPDATAPFTPEQIKAAAVIIEKLTDATSFVQVEALRGEAAAAGLAKHQGIMSSIESARAAVRDAKAARVEPERQTMLEPDAPREDYDPPVDETNSGGEPDETDVLSRIEQMFEGLDDETAIDETRTKVLPAVETLSPAGQEAVKGYYNAAQARAVAKAKPKPAAAPVRSARAQLFSEND